MTRPPGAPAGVLADLPVERARLRRDVTRRSPSTAARATVATTPGLHTRTGPSRARRRRHAAFRSKERGPAVQRTHEAKAARRGDGRSRLSKHTKNGLRTHERAAYVERRVRARRDPSKSYSQIRLLNKDRRAADAPAAQRRRTTPPRRSTTPPRPLANDEPHKQPRAHPVEASR